MSIIMGKTTFVPKQFQDNMGIMSEETFETLKESKVLLVGLGGLGGHVANNLVRLGVHHMGVVDFDRFEGNNLNRQLFSKIENIGKYKTIVASKELQKISADVYIEEYVRKIQDLSDEEVEKYDFIIDAVDNPKTKIYISELGTKLNINVLHGACAGWYGQVGWLTPGNTLLKSMYENEEHGIEKELHNPSFTPAAIASIMTSEFLKFIEDPKTATVNQFLLIDLYDNTIIKTGKIVERKN